MPISSANLRCRVPVSRNSLRTLLEIAELARSLTMFKFYSAKTTRTQIRRVAKLKCRYSIRTMTATMKAPQAKAVTAQDTLATNVSRMVALRHVRKQELAKAMGISPTAIARKLRGEITWSINETAAAADFLDTDVATLLKSNLSLDELLGNGGYNVAVDGDGRIRWGMAGLLDILGWSHNPEVHGSNPCPATNEDR